MNAKLADPVTFECSCGTKSNSVGQTLPDGWAIRRCTPVCGDCALAPAHGVRPRKCAVA